MRDHSDVIFRGTIVQLRDSQSIIAPFANALIVVRDLKKTVVFRVSRVWKGDVGPMFEMPAVAETSMCVGFWPQYLEAGTDLLVYASREQNAEYYTGICGGHKLAKDARRDFKMLGSGKIPTTR